MKASCYWKSAAGPEAGRAGLPARCDVAIIGAGLSGLAVGWWLSRHGIVSCAMDPLVEPGLGAASAAGIGLVEVGTPEMYPRTAGVIGEAAADRVLELTARNMSLIEQFARKRGVPFDRSGSFNLTTEPAEMAELESTARLLATRGGQGRDWIALGGAQADAAAGTSGFIGGVRRPSDGSVDPGAFLRALAAGIAEGGGSVHRGVDVEGIGEEDGGVVLSTSSGPLRAEMAVIAAGAGSVRLHGSLRERIVPVLGQGMAWRGVETGAPASDRGASPPISANFGHIRFRRIPAGGGSSDVVAWHIPWSLKGSDPQGRDHALQPSVQEKIESYLTRRLPCLERGAPGPPGHRWSAHAAYTVDNLPLVGPIPGRPRLICCCGFSGHDWSLAFVAAHDIAQAVAGKGGPEPGSPLSPRRFIDA